MAGFIEVHGRVDGDRICIPIEHILSFTEDGEGTYIETYMDGKYRSWGFVVAESYDEIKNKIKETL